MVYHYKNEKSVKGWRAFSNCSCLLFLCFLCAFATNCGTGESVVERCGQCGMDLSKYTRTLYEVRWTDGSFTQTCGVQCGLTQQLLHQDRYESSMAKDYDTGNLFDASTGYYVFGGKIVADMAPGFIAFQQRADAEKFQQESGGQIMNFDESLSAWAERKERQ